MCVSIAGAASQTRTMATHATSRWTRFDLLRRLPKSPSMKSQRISRMAYGRRNRHPAKWQAARQPAIRSSLRAHHQGKESEWGTPHERCTTLAGQERTTIADYVGDMAALESQIEEALDRQLTEVEGRSRRAGCDARVPRYGQAAPRRAECAAGGNRLARSAPRSKRPGPRCLARRPESSTSYAPKVSPRLCEMTTPPSISRRSAIPCSIPLPPRWEINRVAALAARHLQGHAAGHHANQRDHTGSRDPRTTEGRSSSRQHRGGGHAQGGQTLLGDAITQRQGARRAGRPREILTGPSTPYQ